MLNGHKDQIISINDVPVQQVPKNTLVRFRCMIQDTGLGQEMFLSAYEVRNQDGSTRLECSKYNDEPISVDMSEDLLYSQHLSERTLVYCVSPPGETEWSREAHDVYKGSLEDQLSRLGIYENKSSIKDKYPLPGKQHTSAIVKFYNDMSETLRIGQLVEIIGIRGQNIPEIETDESSFGLASVLSGFPNTAVIHAIAYNSLDQATPLHEDLPDGSIETIRTELIDYIASVLGGDKLAAEFVLLQLLSRVTMKNRGLKIGHITINIHGLPSYRTIHENESPLFGVSNPVTKPLSDLLNSLSMHSVTLPLTIDGLNQSRFSPKSINENLQSGVLQLVDGTVLLVDETVLDEGQLKDTGVRNFQALQNVIQNQLLSYEFPYSQYNFDTDISLLSISTNNSILSNHCSVRIQPLYPLEDSEQSMLKLPKDKLNQFRKFIHSAKYGDYDIPASVSEYIQNAFVEERKKASETGDDMPMQEDLMLHMNLARLVTASFGENELSKERFEYTVQLDKQRKSRMKKQVNKDTMYMNK
ncbi:hypothetical protein RMATCC62417_12499 [Rhizopus microsporus]|nr:hypothetical protein RMATCC62417_12499 [Rhizopus microsporus]